MSKHLRLARLIELMSVIKFHPEWGPKKLAEYFEISEKRLYDDLNELNAGGIPIVYNGKGYSFLSTTALPHVQFSLDEALALLIGGTALGERGGHAYSASARAASAKLFELLPEEPRRMLLALEGKVRIDSKGRGESQAALKSVNAAIASGKTLRMEYYTYSRDSVSTREIDPYGVVYRGNSWYVIGHCHTRGGVRTFRLSRVLKASPTGNTFAYPKGFSIEEYIAKSWSVFQGDETDVVLRFSKKLAPLIEEHQWHPGQRIEKLKDDGIIFRARVRGTLEIRRWVLSWGEGVEVLEPAALREETARHAAALARANAEKKPGH